MKKFNSIAAVGVLIILVVFKACKEKEGEKVTFALSPLEVSFLNENVADSINVSDTLLIDTLIISNDFYRNSLDENNVYLDDVESVVITSCSIDITSPAGFNINDYKWIKIYLNQSGYADELLIAQSQVATSGSTFNFDLSNSSPLLPYFKLVDLPVYVVTSRKNATTSNATLKLKMQFNVTGVNH